MDVPKVAPHHPPTPLRMPSHPGKGHANFSGLQSVTLYVSAGQCSSIASATTVCWKTLCISARWWRRELALIVFPHLEHSASLAFHSPAVTRPCPSCQYKSAESWVRILPGAQIIVCVLDVFVSCPTLLNRLTRVSSVGCRKSASHDARYASSTWKIAKKVDIKSSSSHSL